MVHGHTYGKDFFISHGHGAQLLLFHNLRPQMLVPGSVLPDLFRMHLQLKV